MNYHINEWGMSQMVPLETERPRPAHVARRSSCRCRCAPSSTLTTRGAFPVFTLVVPVVGGTPSGVRLRRGQRTADTLHVAGLWERPMQIVKASMH